MHPLVYLGEDSLYLGKDSLVCCQGQRRSAAGVKLSPKTENDFGPCTAIRYKKVVADKTMARRRHPELQRFNTRDNLL
jgi:hypothetical protein